MKCVCACVFVSKREREGEAGRQCCFVDEMDPWVCFGDLCER